MKRSEGREDERFLLRRLETPVCVDISAESLSTHGFMKSLPSSLSSRQFLSTPVLSPPAFRLSPLRRLAGGVADVREATEATLTAQIVQRSA